jgi:hypothetical protein
MYRRNKILRVNNIIIITCILLVFFISVGYAILSGIIKINFITRTDTSNSIGKWNITTSWVDNNRYYFQYIIKIDNRDGPVLNTEREMSFLVPDNLLLDRCNIWVAESKRLVGNRLYIKCFSWVTNQQPISLEFQLAYSKNVDAQISNFLFKNKYIPDFKIDTKLKK